MQAVWYEKTGAADDVLKLTELPDPEPGPGEVRVRVASSGVNPSDVKTRAGARGGLVWPRVVPHSDGGGVIDAVGAGVDAGRIGQRVWIWNAAWQRAHGTCAEFVALPAAQAVPLPECVDFRAAACLGIPASTAWHAVFADGPVRGKTLLVTGGAGAVGHYAIQFARRGGARVITTVSGERKAEHARSAGPDAIVNYRSDSVVQQILAASDGQGVDRIVEVELGGNLAVTAQVIRPHGVIAAYGSMAVPEPALPFYPLMFRGVTLRTLLVYLLDGAARRAVIDGIGEALASGELVHAIAGSFALDEVAAAHRAVESGACIGNVVVEIPML
ncbi:MAG: NADPH:quinone reductase [Myxococcales bacterium]|nr:NADPH:quinone reductase [Myxococcales bacterium]MDH5306278.1 NADPH:quinone reductase [Myxococcales bacterium]MDH5566789.1 NADPH:quinone reductase [Myxococcales bacterium]